ncbi:MAG: hypothetical protein A3J83_05605 [Elusimicrobia bacterium RIFOXYA2_FULL_40_6]|nr:MAG: hypothetical protein A3J83_05605 [Elusimicrobia bacterium RIFOXYA2_FULL_40_6]
MSVSINEKIKVAAVFDDNKIKPKWFVRNGRKHAISEVTYTWHTKTGEDDILHFSVTDGSTLFEISYNQKTLKWNLDKSE